MKNSGHEIWDDDKKIIRAVEWRDMAVLLRAPSGKAEIFAKEFERAGVPLVVARGGFYDTSEVLDLLSLLQLLDNPLQDVPCIAVLRSPLVGCSLDELAEIRLAAKDVHFWTALIIWNNAESGKSRKRKPPSAKIEKFLERFSRWRKLARQVSLSQCLEEVLAETHYADWLQSRPRGAQRRANVEQFLNLAQRFDQFQRQGLFRFLKFIEAQREAGAEPEVAPVADENAVRLMSIHQSKGLEFPGRGRRRSGKAFNEQDLRGEIILDGEFGLCPRVQPPQTGARYPSLPHWLAQRRQRRELRGEELRLLYVAMTRARDTLILTGERHGEKLGREMDAAAAGDNATNRRRKKFCRLAWSVVRESSPKSKVQSPRRNGRRVAGFALADCSRRGTWAMQLVAAEVTRLKLETISEPSHVGCHEDDGAAEKLRARLEWNYPFKAATRRKAKSSVTELRRAAEELDEEAEPVFSFQFSAKRPARTLAPPTQKRTADSGKRKLIGGGSGNGASQVSPARRAGKNRRSGGARNGGPAAGAGENFVGGGMRGFGFGRAGGFLEFAAGPKNPRAAAGFGEAGIAVHGKIQPGGTGR